MKSSNQITRVAIVVLSLLAGQERAHAVGEVNGKLVGTVTVGTTKEPLPGATVTIRSGALIGKPRSDTTNEDGQFIFADLPPGSYDIEVLYERTKPLRRRVLVRVGETTPINIAWSAEMATEQTYVIHEERHLTRPDSATTGTVFSAEQERRLATGRTYQSVALQTAGVQNNLYTGAGNPFVKGGFSLHNRYLIDGLDVTDPVTQTFSNNLTFDAIGSVRVLTGGLDAQYNSLGGVIETITNQGSDKWSVNASFFASHQALQLNEFYGGQVYDTIQPFNDSTLPISSDYQVNGNLGGPILPHKLWFNLSFEYRNTVTSNVAAPPLNLPHAGQVFARYLSRAKITYAPGDRHRLTLSISADPAVIDNTGATGVGVTKNFFLSTYDSHQDQGGVQGSLLWEYFFRPAIDFNVQAGFKTQYINTGPQGDFGGVDTTGCGMFSPRNCKYDPNAPRHQNLNDRTYWYNSNTVVFDNRYQIMLDPTLNLRGRTGKWGLHDFKAGIQSKMILRDQSRHVPGGYQYSDSDPSRATLENGLCDEAAGKTAACNLRTQFPDAKIAQRAYSLGLFVQDHWQVRSWLTITPGLRFDYGYTQGTGGTRIASLYGFGPRLAAAADLTRDQKTIASAFYGRSTEVVSPLLASVYDQQIYVLQTIQKYNQQTGNWDTRQVIGGPGGARIDKNPTTPHSDEVTLSIRREVFRNAVSAVEYTFKKYSNIWDGIEINQIWDASGQRVIGYVDGKAHQIQNYTTPNGNYHYYQGVDFIAEGHPTESWYFQGAYTLSWTYGPGVSEFGQNNGNANVSQFYNQRLAPFYYGFLPQDTRHQLKLTASYIWHGLGVGAVFSYASGVPRTKLYINATDQAANDYRSPQGTEPGSGNNVAQVAEFRLPDVFTLDMRLSYDFYELIKFHMTVIADVFNILNARPATAVNQVDPNFGQVTARAVLPLRATLGLNFIY
jgi:hypothetical protein